jgi:hypothetical protein
MEDTCNKEQGKFKTLGLCNSSEGMKRLYLPCVLLLTVLLG